jgi:hypothetical protein
MAPPDGIGNQLRVFSQLPLNGIKYQGSEFAVFPVVPSPTFVLRDVKFPVSTNRLADFVLVVGWDDPAAPFAEASVGKPLVDLKQLLPAVPANRLSHVKTLEFIYALHYQYFIACPLPFIRVETVQPVKNARTANWADGF